MDKQLLNTNLQEIFYSFWVIAIAFTTNPFHLFDLTCLAGSLDILEVNISILTEVYNRSQEIKKT